MSKDKEIQTEIEKLNTIFKNMPSQKRSLVEGLIQNAAFMKVTLSELQAEVIENGAVISCQSGNGFDTIKDNPAQKAYTTMISRYAGVIDQLSKYLPDDTEGDELDAWLNQ